MSTLLEHTVQCRYSVNTRLFLHTSLSFCVCDTTNTRYFLCTLRDLIATPASQCVDITPHGYVGEVAAPSRRTPYIPYFIHEKYIYFCRW
jgi:hypothetical protein